MSLAGLSRSYFYYVAHPRDDPAVWILMAALFVVLTPIFFATVIVAFQALVARKKDHDSDAV